MSRLPSRPSRDQSLDQLAPDHAGGAEDQNVQGETPSSCPWVQLGPHGEARRGNLEHEWIALNARSSDEGGTLIAAYSFTAPVIADT